jgi:hypothetical protein
MSKERLSWYEDNAQEIIYNDDGSVTFVFDEPGVDDPVTGQHPTSRTTISKKDYEAAIQDSDFLI